MKHSRFILPITAATSALYFLNSKNNDPALAESFVKSVFLSSASTLNPKFDKRFKKGEDNLVVRDEFICVLDGVGGWSKKGVDAGLMTKELVKYIGSKYDAKEFQNLH